MPDTTLSVTHANCESSDHSDSPCILKTYRIGAWMLIGIGIPTIVEIGPDMLYATVYAKIDNGRLAEWTSQRPDEIDELLKNTTINHQEIQPSRSR
jgi:hypothetical protein